MNICMFNTWFGDCFLINENRNNLFVDFGMHQGSPGGQVVYYPHGIVKSRDDIHKDIADYITNMDNRPNLLLTHYHLDHYSGLLYMKNNNGYQSPIFEKVYIPDIWNLPNSNSIISLLLLESLMDNCRLGKTGCTLLELIQFLCIGVHKVHLVKRGTLFENNRFTALWPDGNKISKIAQKRAAGSEGTYMRRLSDMADTMIEIMNELVEGAYTENRAEIIQTLSSLQENYNSLLNEYESQRDNTLLRLNDFGNGISIVFHNTEECSKNALFTGDIDDKHLKKICDNYDNKFPMHETYYYIKLPHHGTARYYFDFTPFSPKAIMIPNGKCAQKCHEISNKYQADIRNLSTAGPLHVYCSNSNNCKMTTRRKGCNCKCGAQTCSITFPHRCQMII